MDARLIDRTSLSALKPNDIGAWLRQHGYRRAGAGMGDQTAVFAKDTGGQPREVVVPTSTVARDYDVRLEELLADLAEIERVDPGELLLEIGRQDDALHRRTVDILRWLILAVASVACVALVAYLFLTFRQNASLNEASSLAFSGLNLTDPERQKLATELLSQVTAAQALMRSFWLQIIQLLVFNLLLPFVTALLGYLFGREASLGRRRPDSTND
jgi:hypothetical protein